jgi:hypothetical protein
METFSTCLVKIPNCGGSGPADLRALLCEIEDALDAHSYEIVCTGNQNIFSIPDTAYGPGFNTFIQFTFPVQLSSMEEIEKEIRSQIEGACSIDIIASGKGSRLLQIEKCEISFK